MTADEPPRCDNCRFYAANVSRCRRHAPIVVVHHEGAGSTWPTTVRTDYPAVFGHDWCGDHEPRKETHDR